MFGGYLQPRSSTGEASQINLQSQVLDSAKSTYLPPFLNLRELIQKEAVAAEDNLKFLLVLEEPCQALAQAPPSQIPALLPPIINCVRLVWNLSRFYNTPDRIVGLLRKVWTHFNCLGAAEGKSSTGTQPACAFCCTAASQCMVHSTVNAVYTCLCASALHNND